LTVTASDAVLLAGEIDQRIGTLTSLTVAAVRQIRREYSRRVRAWTGIEVLELALALRDRWRWVAYELLYHHPSGLSQLDAGSTEALGRGMGSWGDVDSFGRYVSGPAWLRNVVDDGLIRRWAARQDRWWRRAALVSTVPLNLRAAGGTGDPDRTLDICRRLVHDRDDMVVKALSWALRELVRWDPDGVRTFLSEHDDVLAARVRREVTSKLETGLKQRRR
jgi:3-methyladenine DNA glycosylase AlkD